VILALKGVYFVVENIEFISDSEISYQLDADDLEKETENLNEFEKINQISHTFYNFYRSKLINEYVVIIKKYLIEYLEFTTPPPQFT
jgi:hypothetical protein